MKSPHTRLPTSGRTLSPVKERGNEKAPGDRNVLQTNLPNERGLRGRELVQLFINKTSSAAFWKRKIINREV